MIRDYFNKLGVNKSVKKNCQFSLLDEFQTTVHVNPSQILVNSKNTSFKVMNDLVNIKVNPKKTLLLNILANQYFSKNVNDTSYTALNNSVIYMTPLTRIATFTVVDNEDRSKKLTSFTLKLNGVNTDYTVNSDSSISLAVSTTDAFTVQITGIDGYVDGSVWNLVYATLSGKQFAMNAISHESKAIFDASWNLASGETSYYDFYTYVTIKDGSTTKGTVYYSTTSYSDDTTTVQLNHDAHGSTATPETITVTKINDDYTYYYYVNDYSYKQGGTGHFEDLGLTLDITLNNTTVTPKFSVPSGADSYYYWNVCAIKHGKIYRASDYITVLGNSADTTWADSL